MKIDVSPKRGREDTWEWHIKDTERRTLPLTTERFYLAVRKDVLDRARVASEASGKGESVAHLLRASEKSSEDAENLVCKCSSEIELENRRVNGRVKTSQQCAG